MTTKSRFHIQSTVMDCALASTGISLSAVSPKYVARNTIITSTPTITKCRIRQDILPGRVTNYRITPILVGNYKVMCSQLCGTSHSYMIAPVIVTSQADYDAWVQSQAAAAQAAAAAGGPANGKLLVSKYGCLGCHSTDSSKLVGPTWQGLYQSQVKLADGKTVTADQAYLIESIMNPSAKIVNGFPDNVMPKTFGTALTQSQINDIVSYIESLK